MLAEVVFATRLLGLVSGERDISLTASDDVRQIEIRRGEKTIAAFTSPPWRGKVKLGPDLGPYLLTAIGFDERGVEAGRDTQIVNLARAPADAGVLLSRSEDGRTLFARLQWTHILGKQPTSAVMTFDDRVVSKAATSEPVSLGAVDPAQIHAVGVKVTFDDGTTVTKDVVFGGIYTEEMPAELTAIPVRQRQASKGNPGPCFRVGGKAVAPSGIEHPDAQVAFVVNGGAGVAVQDQSVSRRYLYEITGAEMRVISPVMKEGAQAADSFGSERIPLTRGTRAAVMMDRRPKGRKRYTDAIAASALRAVRDGARRAVVYVIGASPAEDQSENSPAAVRRYLQRIGVPLYVWSLTGPRPDLAATWGEVRDVSTSRKLLDVTEELRNELLAQRIAWIPAGPLEALEATATEDCAFEPLAKGGGS